MERAGEQEEDEFFESMQQISSSSSSESSEEGGVARRKLITLQTRMSDSLNGKIRYQVSSSPYEIWKNNPGTILERRQRLLIEMGLEPEKEEAGSVNGRILVPSTEATGTAPYLPFAGCIFPSDSYANEQDTIQGRSASAGLKNSKLDNVHNGDVLRCTDGSALGWCALRSRLDGSFSTPQQNDAPRADGTTRLAICGIAAPLLLGKSEANERLEENSGAVLRTGATVSACAASIPPFGGKISVRTTPIPAARFFTQERAGRWVQSHTNNTDSSRFESENSTSPLDTRSLGCNSYGETLQRIIGQGQYLVQGCVQVQDIQDDNAEGNRDELCRIKNLESGKEFVVKELGKDGSLTKLKDIDTGRELTLEEFESSLGLSPIIQEVMRRERAAEENREKDLDIEGRPGPVKKKRGWLKTLRGVMRGSREKGSHGGHGCVGEEREGSYERSGSSFGSATDDSQGISPQTAKRIKVHAHRKTFKEFTELHMGQEIQAHQGAIWTMKFSLDGCYLASAGQDRVVRVWDILEQNKTAEDSHGISGDLNFGSGKVPEGSGVAQPQSHQEVKKSSKGNAGRKKVQMNTHLPPKRFLLSEKPRRCFEGHTEDILDLSWSTSQLLLSSSMDKTVRLWHISCKDCLRVFTHNDYVTCIQFNPVDDGYFLSGSLDDKIRIWSIKDWKVVDWADLREMVTAACYKPDGQGAVVGSYKGTCRFYNTSGNKLQLDATIDVRSNKRKKCNGKKITGLQFVPGDCRKVLITSSDSRIRVYDGTEISAKYKGLRNTKGHISAAFCLNGKYIICASEDSRVCIWNSASSSGYTTKQIEKCGSYEDFCSRHVLVALPWPGIRPQAVSANLTDQEFLQKCESSLSSTDGSHSSERDLMNTENSSARGSSGGEEPGLLLHSLLGSSDAKSESKDVPISTGRDDLMDEFLERIKAESPTPGTHDHSGCLAWNKKFSCFSGVEAYLRSACVSNLEDSEGSMLSRNHFGSHSFFSDGKGSATWPEEKLPRDLKQVPDVDAVPEVDAGDMTKSIASVFGEVGIAKSAASARGLVIVTAGLDGEMRTFQNYGFPVRL